jgi:hypothetical protein
MTREKRLKRVVSYIPHSLYEQLELFKGEESNVLSMSDYLHEVIEQHLELRAIRSIRISKQRIGRRVGNQ